MTSLSVGDYRVFIKNSGYQIICEKVITLTNGTPPSFLIIDGSENAFQVPETNEEKDFTLFPNPTFNNFNVSFDSRLAEKYTVIITDIMGTEHFRSVTTAIRNSTNLEVKCDMWTTGVYFVRLVNDKQRMKIKRIVVARE